NAAAITPPNHPSRTKLPRVSLPEGNGAPPPVVAQTPILPAPEVVETPCPRCGRKLINPLDLGWCQSCGYCQSLEQDRARVDIPNVGMARRLSWIGPLVVGVIGAVLINVPPCLMLTPDSLERALWTTAVIVVGVLMILGAQLWALLALAADDEHRRADDMCLAVRLWGMGPRTV